MTLVNDESAVRSAETDVCSSTLRRLWAVGLVRRAGEGSMDPYPSRRSASLTALLNVAAPTIGKMNGQSPVNLRVEELLARRDRGAAATAVSLKARLMLFDGRQSHRCSLGPSAVSREASAPCAGVASSSRISSRPSSIGRNVWRRMTRSSSVQTIARKCVH